MIVDGPPSGNMEQQSPKDKGKRKAVEPLEETAKTEFQAVGEGADTPSTSQPPPEKKKMSYAERAVEFQKAKAQPVKPDVEAALGIVLQNGITSSAFKAVDDSLFGDAPADVNAYDFYVARLESASWQLGDFTPKFKAIQSEYSKALRSKHAKGAYRQFLEAQSRRLEEDFIASSAALKGHRLRGG